MFDLEKAIATWRHQYQHRRFLLREDLDELERYLRDYVTHRMAEGEPPEAAFRAALRTLGDVGGAEVEYRKVYWAKLRRRRRFLHELLSHFDMLKNYLTIAWRNLAKHKGYAFINISGLALGMACCLLIFMLVRHEWSFDRFHTEADRIHRVLIQETKLDGEVDYRILMPPGMPEELVAEVPGVEAWTRVVRGTMNVLHEGQEYGERFYEVDSSFFQMFTFPLLAGDAASVLRDPNGIVLTESRAVKYFGERVNWQEILGETVTVSRNNQLYPFLVTGVVPDFPQHSSLDADMLLSFEQYGTLRLGGNDWGGRTSLYLLLEEGRTGASVEAVLPAFTERYFANRIERRRAGDYIAEGPDAFKLILQPLPQIHFEPARSLPYERAPHDPRYSAILAGIALLVLLLACINFMTLSIGRSAGRAREVGMRKVLGAHRGQLMKQFWGEALLLSLVALILGLILVVVLLPTFNTLTGEALALSSFVDPMGLLLLVALLLVVGLIAGGYPAAVLSRFQPAMVLKGIEKLRGKNWLTQGLVVVQFTASIGLIMCAGVMYQQLNYLLNKDLGFEDEQVMVVGVFRLEDSEKDQLLGVMRNQLMTHADILDVSRIGYPFTQGYDTRSWMTTSNEPRRAHMIGADFNFLDLMEIELVAGRNFSLDLPSDSTRSVIINEAYAREFGITDPLGHQLTGFNGFFGEVTPTVIGVVRDFNFRSLHEEVAPAVLNVHPDYYGSTNGVLVKVAPGGVQASVERVRDTWNLLFPEKPFEYSFLNEDLATLYENEERWSQIVAYATLIALLIACMGLFGLATLAVARRTKEIGIRKVLGASTTGLTALVAKEFALLVGVAIVLAWPLAYFWSAEWLTGFAYSITLPWGVFALASLAALGIALATVSFHALRAATANPVQTLRYE